MDGKSNPADLEWVKPVYIKPSEENPRAEEFYKDKDFLRLKESVSNFGVIVPIIIKKLLKPEDGIKYQLIDGERRWKAAMDTNQDTIPAYVLPADRDLNILATMFQIHMNQEEWNAVEQVRALEKMIPTLKAELKKQYSDEEEIDEELVKQIMVITGMNETNALSRIRFLRWPRQLRDHIYRETDKNYYSYAVEIEAKIVEPALRNFPEIIVKISPDKIREALFEKVTSGYVGRAEEIRDAGILTKKRRKKKELSKAKHLFLQFVKDKTFSFSDAREQYISLFPDEVQKPPVSPRKLLNIIRTVVRVLTEYTEVTLKKLRASQKKDLRVVLDELLIITKAMIKRLE
jgi:ParB/RepB/Spo0J family partition protein